MDDKVARFIFALYGVSAKIKQNPLSRVFRVLSTNTPVERATQVSNQVARIYSFNGNAQMMKTESVDKLREILNTFVIEICGMLGEANGGNIFSIKNCTKRFIDNWNKEVKLLKNVFLPKFGDIFSPETILLSYDNISDVFKTFQTFKHVPDELKMISEKKFGKLFVNAIRTCCNVDKGLFTRQRVSSGNTTNSARTNRYSSAF